MPSFCIYGIPFSENYGDLILEISPCQWQFSYRCSGRGFRVKVTPDGEPRWSWDTGMKEEQPRVEETRTLVRHLSYMQLTLLQSPQQHNIWSLESRIRHEHIWVWPLSK